MRRGVIYVIGWVLLLTAGCESDSQHVINNHEYKGHKFIMLKDIWQSEIETSIPPVTDLQVKLAEEELGVKLPKSYINILKEQNGGSIIYDAYPTDQLTYMDEDYVEIYEIRGINHNDLMDNRILNREWEMPNDVWLLSGDGHTWLALDYRHTKENPPVIFIDNNSDDKVITEIAPDFTTFFKGLINWDEQEGVNEMSSSSNMLGW